MKTKQRQNGGRKPILDQMQVERARKLRGEVPLRDLAKRFGVSVGALVDAFNRK
jgi:hypothetical protein